jgi:CRISPR-associated endoribonuclease Cas6/Csy4 subtype I-F
MLPSHYIEIEVEPGAGASGPILARVVEALHGAFAGRFALGFPEMRPASKEELHRPLPASPGSRIHVFGGEDLVSSVGSNPAIIRLRDYIHVSRSRAVRLGVQHCAWVRCRKAMSTPALRERKLRRATKRAEARGETIAADDPRFSLRETRSELPFINVRSASNGHRFTMFFDRRLTDAAVNGEFDNYGFSKNGSTVPYLA